MLRAGASPAPSPIIGGLPAVSSPIIDPVLYSPKTGESRGEAGEAAGEFSIPRATLKPSSCWKKTTYLKSLRKVHIKNGSSFVNISSQQFE